MVQLLTYCKWHSYTTESNQHRVVKTPGGKLVYQTTKKRASGPKCPVTGKRIQGEKLSAFDEMKERLSQFEDMEQRMARMLQQMQQITSQCNQDVPAILQSPAF